MKKHIEAEKGELIIVSDEGHRAIIPAKDRKHFLDSLNGCDDCINKYIQQLPMMSNYAEDGSLVPDDGDPIKKETYEQWGDRIRKIAPNLDYTKDGDYNYRGAYEAGLEPVEVDNNGVKEYHLGSRNPKTGEILKYRSHPTFNQAISEDVKMGYVPYEKDGRIYTVDRKSKEYKDLYDSGKLLGYDRVNDLYIAPDLGGATIKATKPQWMKDKEALEKEYSKDWYIDNNLPKFSRSMGISSDNMGGNQKGYDEYINNKVAESILKRNPKVGFSNNERLAWYNSLSEKERDIVNNSYSADKFSPAVRAYMKSQSNEAKKYGVLETFRDVNKLAQSVEGTPERFRIFPNAENNYENYVNPLMWIGDMAKGLGNVPKDIKEENYLKAAGSVASPLLGGALGGLGAKTTGQFIKNTFLPLGGLEENIVKEGASSILGNIGKNKLKQNIKLPPHLTKMSQNPNIFSRNLKANMQQVKSEYYSKDFDLNHATVIAMNKQGKLNHLLKSLENDDFKLLAELDAIPNKPTSDDLLKRAEQAKKLIRARDPKIKTTFQSSEVPYLKDPIEENKYQLLKRILGDSLDNYVYFKEFDDGPKMFYADPKYKDFSELISAINKGDFKLSNDGVKAYNDFFNKAVEKYPNAIPYGSSKLIDDLNALPGDIDLGRAGPGTSKFIYEGDRKITDLNYPEVLHQHYAYNHPELYEKAHREAVEESLRTGKEVTPKFDKIENKDFNPKINTLMDMFMSTKDKHISRTGVYLANTKDFESAKKAIDTKKRLLSSTSNWDIPNVELSNLESNTRYLKALGYSDEMITKINSEPERLKLIFENDYVNRITASRRINTYKPEDMTVLDKIFFNDKGTGIRAHGDGIYASSGNPDHFDVYGDLNSSFQMSPTSKINTPEDILSMEFKGVESPTKNIRVIKEVNEPFKKGIVNNPTFRVGNSRTLFESRGSNNKITNPNIQTTKTKAHTTVISPKSFSSPQMEARYIEYYNKMKKFYDLNPEEVRKTLTQVNNEISTLKNNINELTSIKEASLEELKEIQRLKHKYEKAMNDRELITKVIKGVGIGVGAGSAVAGGLIKLDEYNKSFENKNKK